MQAMQQQPPPMPSGPMTQLPQRGPPGRPGGQRVQKVMTQPINVIFKYLQSKARVQIWLYEQTDMRIEGPSSPCALPQDSSFPYVSLRLLFSSCTILLIILNIFHFTGARNPPILCALRVSPLSPPALLTHLGVIMGFDEYMNIVLDNAEEVYKKKGTRKAVGRILLKGDNIAVILNTGK